MERSTGDWAVMPDVYDASSNPMWRCILCNDGRPHRAANRARHENSAGHQLAVQHRDTEHLHLSTARTVLPAAQTQDMIEDAVRHLLGSMAGHSQPPPVVQSRPRSPPVSQLNWGLFEATEHQDLEAPPDRRAVQSISEALLEYLDNDMVNSDDEEVERSDAEDMDNGDHMEPPVPVDDGTSTSDARPRMRTHDDAQPSHQWFPWHDKITCTLDILMHLPRSVFSHRQLDLFLWLLKVNDVDDVPSVKSMQSLNAKLQKMCGVDSIGYKGALGHNYYVNDLAQILAQEMANPKVRPHLHFYPEDTRGASLSEARQAARWLEEIPDHLITPMARIGLQDFYIHEPAMLRSGVPCMPVRWFTRVEGGQQVLFAKCWKLEDEFLKTFPELQQDAKYYGIPDPACIIDTVDDSRQVQSPWTLTDPTVGNRWRALAKGHRVLGFALWAYCDDTSGNLSKKWNEHNSFLITPAGLPRHEAQKEYNIHFLSTSNIAPPLEMMDGVVTQMEKAQDEGIWAWDCLLNESVLLVPFVLALLGDNPMQSEFACHIGLAGKFFCRNCWVKGHDQLQTDEPPGDRFHAEGDRQAGSDTDIQSDSDKDGVDNTSTRSSSGKKFKKLKKKAVESMTDMVARVKAFIKVGQPRCKTETVAQLNSYFQEASKLNTKTKVSGMRTASGIKDTFQLFFLEDIFASYKKKQGKDAKEAALRAKLESLPINIISPVWRIKGLDPHQDTPVEVLHVVLLGFVKYLWRDLVQNQLKKKDEKLDLLATRLSSFDVTGLGISPLAGKTLVQYSGSLTGRDFRAIAQAAPFVIYDLVSDDCYETWVALSKLIPLIWQPHIENVSTHLALLEKEIQYFLLCAARWTTRWFNKPKFHILLHLVEHIRRFGPASLFATEAFESFNAIIRAKSVHSNRQAPSRDIAIAFAQGNRIRHLLSGGLFMVRLSETNVFSHEPESWTHIGAGPAALVHGQNTVTRYLSLDEEPVRQGICIVDQQPARAFTELLIAKVFPSAGGHILGRVCKTGSALRLDNGDICKIGQYVVVKMPGAGVGETYVGRVEEIIQIKGSPDDELGRPDTVLIRHAVVTQPAAPYRMPDVVLSPQWSMTVLENILCTVNVQHKCAEHQCTTSGARSVYQERRHTDQIRPAVAHRTPSALVLNTAQMRDAIHVQRFRIASPSLDTNQIVHASVAREVDAQKVVNKAATTPGMLAVVSPIISTTALGGNPTTRSPPLSGHSRSPSPQHSSTFSTTFHDSPIPGPNTQTFGGSPPSSVPPAILSPAFVDTLAQDYNLEPQQRANLHAFVQLGSIGGGLSQADLATRTYTLAVMFHQIAEQHRRDAKENLANLAQLFNDLKIRLEESFTFTGEQRANIRRMTQDAVYQADRTAFIAMHLDVERMCREHQTNLKLTNVYGNPAREKQLMALIKKTCSSVRNAFRQDIRDSILGDNRRTLTEFSYDSALKYKRGGPGEQLDLGFVVHNAILRRFGLEHTDLIGVQEAEDSDINEDGDSDEAPKKKRKRRAGGRITKGEDFWSRVDAFFVKEVAARGKRLTGSQWKPYVEESIARDDARSAACSFSAGRGCSPTVPGGAGTSSRLAGGLSVLGQTRDLTVFFTPPVE
ncbi:hypothetical protein B0H21DRAFT_890351 [Amylocystis lapponica]|nr:hypothetical protein B0H21DRAFT_890351 [Amylocystis lapponica]